jgi:hypothetical protein
MRLVNYNLYIYILLIYLIGFLSDLLLDGNKLLLNSLIEHFSAKQLNDYLNFQKK